MQKLGTGEEFHAVLRLILTAMDLADYIKEHKDSFTDIAHSLYQRMTACGDKIDFEIKKQDSWGMQEIPDEKRYTIIDPGQGANPSAMIHELLHVDLAQKGFKNDVTIRKHFLSTNSFFGSVYGGSLIPELNNKIAHVRMIKEFLALGEDPDTFLHETASAYFDNVIEKDLVCMKKLKEAGGINIGATIFKFIYHTGSAKLFACYAQTKISDEIFQMLRAIDA